MTTTISANSLAQDSRVFLTNLAGACLKVASLTTTTVTVDDASALTGASLYDSTHFGVLIIIEGVNSSDAGKTAKITGVSGNDLTVDTDFDTTPALADGSKIAVIPPMACELFPNGGHTLDATTEDDETMGLTETFLTHSTRLLNRVGGNVPIFAADDSEGFARILMAGVGGYDKSTTATHDFAPFKSGLSGIEDKSDFSLFTIDGNSVVQTGWYSLFGTQLTIDIPEDGIVTASLDVLGAGATRIVGGTGKTLPSGYPAANLGTDRGFRHSSHGCLVEFGGSLGDAITDSNDKFVSSASVTISRGALEDTALGSRWLIKPDEETHTLTMSITRYLEDDAMVDYAWGSDLPEPGAATTTRAVLHMVSPRDSTKLLTIDVPKAKVRRTTTRQRGRFREDITVTAIHTLEADGDLDATDPLYRIRFVNGDDSDYGATL